MTLILGYIHSDSSIHLVSDSAETWETSNPEQVFPQKGGFTSFGDAIVFDESTVIEESAQKIYQINESILIGFSGDVLEGKGVIDDLIIKFSESHNYDVLAILQIYFDQNIPQKSQFIIAFQEKVEAQIMVECAHPDVVMENLKKWHAKRMFVVAGTSGLPKFE